MSESIAREIHDCAGQPGIPCGTRRIATAGNEDWAVMGYCESRSTGLTEPSQLDRKKAIPVSFIAPLHLRVLGFGFLQDWDVGVGVFPEREEVLGRRSAP